MNKSIIDEYLVNLYLRLNGYISTGLIVHTPTWGQTATDIDIIAIKHPHHQQNDREIQTSNFIQVPSDKQDKIDVIFCEVKNTPEALRFNNPIKNDVNTIIKSLNWLGLIPTGEVDDLAVKIIEMFKDNAPIALTSTGVTYENFNFRALLCCPNLHTPYGQWALNCNEIFTFISRCLCPEEPRNTCSTRYNFKQWGFITSDIVKYFKENKQPNIDGLYRVFEL